MNVVKMGIPVRMKENAQMKLTATVACARTDLRERTAQLVSQEQKYKHESLFKGVQTLVASEN